MGTKNAIREPKLVKTLMGTICIVSPLSITYRCRPFVQVGNATERGITMFEVSVYYNENVMAMIKGFNLENKLCHVATKIYNGNDVKHIAESVFADMQECENEPLLRSMSVGDVIRIRYCLGNDMFSPSTWLSVAMRGYTLIEQPYYIR